MKKIETDMECTHGVMGYLPRGLELLIETGHDGHMIHVRHRDRRQEAGQDESFEDGADDLLAAFGAVDVGQGLGLSFLGVAYPPYTIWHDFTTNYIMRQFMSARAYQDSANRALGGGAPPRAYY
jgi:hypothetical protein